MNTLTHTSRTLYRHDNGMGTVIEFDMYDTNMKMFVPDAKYRPANLVQWGNESCISETINNHNFYITVIPHDSNTILADIPTDEALQSKSRLSLSSIQTAKECTDAMISAIGSSTNYAAGLARSISIDNLGTMDLPNLYELMVIWCEADNIDNMDPTAETYFDAKIGYTHSLGRFRGSRMWSSSEYSSHCAWGVYYHGFGYGDYTKRDYRYVIPIKEL